MVRDLTAEPLFPIEDIQGDILVGLPKRVERLLFFSIDDADDFKEFLNALEVTSVAECLVIRDLIAKRKAAGIQTLVPTPGLNVAFTYAGLTRLGIPGLDDAVDELAALRDGMAKRTEKGELTDPPAQQWQILRPNPRLHGVFILTGASEAETTNTIALRLAPVPGNGWHIVHQELGKVRPDPVKGHEHFGYADGVSQPGVRGRVAPGTALSPTSPLTPPNEEQAEPGQDLLWPGEFLFGYPGQDAHAPEFTVEGAVMQPPVPFMANGAYLVFRRLGQLVPELDSSVKTAAAAIGGASEKASADLLGAQLVGRWKSGAPIIKAPTADDPGLAEGTDFVNNFEFGDDREGLSCPWAAHIRKAYPRNDVRHETTPEEDEVKSAEAFTQAHRMLRRGIAFGPELTEHEALSGHSDPGRGRGLLFKCYVTSIEDQFEFVQQAWVNSDDFSQPGSGIDAIIGQSPVDPAPFLGAAPTTQDPAKKPQLHFAHFVAMQGGEYFFAPAIPALRGL
jgi:Dyp-type peroxidase family